MYRENKIVKRSALLSFRFVLTAVVGSVVMGLVAAFGTVSTQLAMLGCFISVVGGLFLAFLDQEDERERQRTHAIESLSAPITLASDREIFGLYETLCDGLRSVAGQPEGILRDASIQKLSSIAEQVTSLAAGEVVFAQTEAWRTTYERLLLSPHLKSYRSVAWVQTPDYWQDSPGQQSMKVNFEAVERGVSIERIMILPDPLWPAEASLPLPGILPWIEKQQEHGVKVSLVRESEAEREPDLLSDMGIYGTWAVGIQELDERSRTLRFTLRIDPQAVRAAEDRWRRLSLYANSFKNTLERSMRS